MFVKHYSLTKSASRYRKNVRLLEDNEKMVHEVRLKNNEIEKITLRMNILSNEILTRNSKQK
jgi:preprotein translocase subunit SecA